MSKLGELERLYMLMLGRRPIPGEHNHAEKNIAGLAENLIETAEFKEFQTIERRKELPLNEELVTTAYLTLLKREPEDNMDIKIKIGNLLNAENLVKTFLNCPERIQLVQRRKKLQSLEFNNIARMIYLHIPKAAGTSLHFVLERNYPGSALLKQANDKRKWETQKVIGGHFTRDFYSGMSEKHLFVSVVRNPLDRAISMFNYLYSRGELPGNLSKISENPVEILSAALDDPFARKLFLDNLQCKYISGDKTFAAVSKQLEKSNYVIGVLDNIENFVNYLGVNLNWKYLGIPTINTAKNKKYSAQFRENRKIMETILENNSEDSKLYAFAKSSGVIVRLQNNFDFACFEPTAM